MKAKAKIPMKYDRKFDSEILDGLARKFDGSLVGEIAAQKALEIIGRKKRAKKFIDKLNKAR